MPGRSSPPRGMRAAMTWPCTWSTSFTGRRWRRASARGCSSPGRRIPTPCRRGRWSPWLPHRLAPEPLHDRPELRKDRRQVEDLDAHAGEQVGAEGPLLRLEALDDPGAQEDRRGTGDRRTELDPHELLQAAGIAGRDEQPAVDDVPLKNLQELVRPQESHAEGAAAVD